MYIKKVKLVLMQAHFSKSALLFSKVIFGAEFSTDYVSNIVATGRNNMPSFGDLLTSTEIRLISEHVRTLNKEITNRNGL